MLIFVSLVLVSLVFCLYGFIPSNKIKKEFFKRDKSNKNEIFLTFDDGPSEYTEELLDLLKEYEVKATFFCVARFAKKYPEIIERMKEEGHTIALHSLKHKNAMLQIPTEVKKDIKESLEIMKSFGLDVKLYRPPWGDCNLSLLKALKKEGLRLVLWDVMAEDWEKQASYMTIADKLLSRTGAGDIICLHDRKRKSERCTF